MTRRVGSAAVGIAIAAAVVAVAALGVVAPADAHGYHLTVSPQTTDDGTVTVESLFAMTEGFVALHTAEGPLDEPVGHVAVAGGSHAGVEVTAESEFWRGFDGTETLRVAIHRDVDGDGEFDPETDEVASMVGSRAVESVPVRKVEDGRTFVVTDTSTQRSSSPVASVPRAGLASDGFVVLETLDDRVVGHRRLEAGVHDQVSVPIDEGFFAEIQSFARLRAIVYADDGDGAFSDGDEPVTVGDRAVASRLFVRKTNGTASTPAVGTAAETESATDGATIPAATETGADTDATTPAGGATETETERETETETETAVSATRARRGLVAAMAIGIVVGIALLVRRSL